MTAYTVHTDTTDSGSSTNYTAFDRQNSNGSGFKIKVPAKGAFNTAAPKDASIFVSHKGDFTWRCEVHPLVKLAG